MLSFSYNYYATQLLYQQYLMMASRKKSYVMQKNLNAALFAVSIPTSAAGGHHEGESMNRHQRAAEFHKVVS
jgi:hypothetical protein